MPFVWKLRVLLVHVFVLIALIAGAQPALQSLPMKVYEDLGLIPKAQPPRLPGSKTVAMNQHRSAHALTSSGSYPVDLTTATRLNNLNVKMKNVGSQDIINPWVVLNGKRNFFSTQTILDEALESETDPKKRAFRIWWLVRNHRYHWYPAEATLTLHSPAQYLNVYGAGFCDDSAAILECLWKAAGFQSARSWEISGHVISEVFYNGAYHMLDADLEVFYPKSNNQTLASVQELAANASLINRVSAPNIAELYTTTGNNYTFQGSFNSAPTMAMVLRPGESLERCFFNWGKYHDNLYSQPQPVYGNGRLAYEPELTSAVLSSKFESVTGIEVDESTPSVPLVQPETPGSVGSIKCRMESPFVFVGGNVAATVNLSSAADSLTLRFSKDNVTWQTIGTKYGPFNGSYTAAIDTALAPTSSRATYKWYVDVQLDAGNANSECVLTDLRLEGEIQCNIRALPTLEPGVMNNTQVTFATTAGGALEVSHEWESSDTAPPFQPSTAAIFPLDGATTSSFAPELCWQSNLDTNSVRWREVLVSWDQDGVLPVSPVFHVQKNGPGTFTSPAGWLKENVTYYWKVRQENATAPWSQPFSFNISSTASVKDWAKY